MSVRVNALDHLVINVADVARSTEWYHPPNSRSHNTSRRNLNP